MSATLCQIFETLKALDPAAVARAFQWSVKMPSTKIKVTSSGYSVRFELRPGKKGDMVYVRYWEPVSSSHQKAGGRERTKALGTVTTFQWLAARYAGAKINGIADISVKTRYVNAMTEKRQDGGFFN